MKQWVKNSVAFLLCVSLVQVKAQQVKAWVFFNDKPKTAFDAATYFTPKNLARKQKQQLPVFDAYDLPVNAAYVQTVAQFCDSITFVSRWMNAACVYTNQNNIQALSVLPFVREIEQVEFAGQLANANNHLSDLHAGELNLLNSQVMHMQGNVFAKHHFTAKGVTIAVIDAGFSGYKQNKAISFIRGNGQIKHTYDYIKKSANVDLGSSHGTAVLSCMAGKLDSVFMGCAYDADFLLYRTEKAFNEKLNEEEYWLAAMEEADRQGADIINTSLGYNNRRYFQKDMNGKKSILARAANLACKKGMLVVCSAGNEGDVDWKVICTPADADSALAVGAINPWTGVQASWSSFGPSADKRIKPNVSAFGYVMGADGSDGVDMTLGTSFSSPLVAGFAACVKQMYPTVDAFTLLKKIEHSANLYPYYDYAHGYGVPQANRLLDDTLVTVAPTFDVIQTDDSLTVVLHKDVFAPTSVPVVSYYSRHDDTTKQYVKVDGSYYKKSFHFADGYFSGTSLSYIYQTEPGYFYYNTRLENEPALNEYAVTNVRQQKIVAVKKQNFAVTYMFHYRGYTKTITF